MAKELYKIPTDLRANYMDMEIALQGKDGVGLRPLAVKVILFYILSAIILLWFMLNSFMSHAPFAIKGVFVISWAAMTYQMACYTNRKEMQFTMLLAFTNYIGRGARRIFTRRTSSANAFYGVLGITSIDDDSGLIEYADNTYGYCYKVVGSASVFLFDEDRNRILDRVDYFYRKLTPDVEIITITKKESQKIYKQVGNLQDRYNNLEVRDPDLEGLLEEQFDIYKNYVGDTFRSIHQYWILKADNRESLTVAHNTIRSEVEGSALMIKQCVPLYKDDIYDVLGTFYQEEEVRVI